MATWMSQLITAFPVPDLTYLSETFAPMPNAMTEFSVDNFAAVSIQVQSVPYLPQLLMETACQTDSARVE